MCHDRQGNLRHSVGIKMIRTSSPTLLCVSKHHLHRWFHSGEETCLSHSKENSSCDKCLYLLVKYHLSALHMAEACFIKALRIIRAIAEIDMQMFLGSTWIQFRAFSPSRSAVWIQLCSTNPRTSTSGDLNSPTIPFLWQMFSFSSHLQLLFATAGDYGLVTIARIGSMLSK